MQIKAGLYLFSSVVKMRDGNLQIDERKIRFLGFSAVLVGLTAAALLLTLIWPAMAQTDRVTGEARRFLLYPVQSLIEFAERGDGTFNLSYHVQPKDWTYGFNVNVVRYASEKIALEACRELADWHRSQGYQVNSIAGYVCAFVAVKQFPEKRENGRVTNIAGQLRSADYVVGAYLGDLSESSYPPRTEGPPVGPLLAALKGEQPLTAAEVAFRNLLFPALGFTGDTARSCLDEVMNWAEGQSDNTMRDQIAQLRKAATAARTVEVLAGITARPEDFDSQWWDALREVVPNPATPNDPQQTATDFLIDLLPPPYNTLINVGRNTHKGLQAAKNHITDPKVRGEIYACYRRERGGHSPSTGGAAGAYESGLSHILLDATAACPAAAMFKNSYENEMKGLSGQERDDAFRRLITPVAIRFEFIYRVEDARANRATLVADAWKPVQNVLEKLKTRVNACIAKPR